MNKKLFSNKVDTFYIPSCWEAEPEEKDMCDISGIDKLLVILVRKEIESLVAGRKIFSAWDITKKLRAELGDGYDVSHGDVREVVKDWFAEPGNNHKGQEDWSRTLIRMTNDKVTYVYHPLTVMAEDYPSFDELVDTMTPKADSCCGSCCDDGQKYEEAYDDLEDAAVCFASCVDGFLEGEETLNELKEALEEFRAAHIGIEKDLGII